MHDLAAQHPERVRDMTEQYELWANRCGVIPREKILELMEARRRHGFLGRRKAEVSCGLAVLTMTEGKSRCCVQRPAGDHPAGRCCVHTNHAEPDPDRAALEPADRRRLPDGLERQALSR